MTTPREPAHPRLVRLRLMALIRATRRNIRLAKRHDTKLKSQGRLDAYRVSLRLVGAKVR